MVGFLVLLAFTAFTFVVGQLLAPTPKSNLKPNLGSVRPPGADKGRPIPVIFGTVKLAPNVTWFGNIIAKAITKRVKKNLFQSTNVTVGYNYGCDMHTFLCHGPIDELIDIVFGDKSLLGVGATITENTLPATSLTWKLFHIVADTLFGGKDLGGGLTGDMEFHFGDPNGTAGPKYLASEAALHYGPQYKGMVHAFWKNTLFGTSPQIAPMFFILRRCPSVLGQPATANIDGDANAADCIYEILTNYKWGMGMAAGSIDLASFQAAATTLYEEGMGVSATFDAEANGEDAIGELLRHVDGVLFTHPTTGLLVLKLARLDYVVEELPLLDESNAELLSFTRGSWADTINEIKINYVQRGVDHTFREDVSQAQNLASVQAMGRVVSQSFDFAYFTNPDIAQQAAFRALRVTSVPLAKARVRCNRGMYNLTMGSVVRLNWARYNIEGMLFRVTSPNYGSLYEGQMELELMEDVFGINDAAFTPPPEDGAPGGWEEPSTEAVAASLGFGLWVPYWYTATATDHYVMFLFVRGSKNTPSLNLYPYHLTTAYAALGAEDQPFAQAGATLPAALDEMSNDLLPSLVVEGVFDMDELTSTDATGRMAGARLAVIANSMSVEFIAWETITDNGDGTYTLTNVMRGQLDTTPRFHPVDTPVIFIDEEFAVYSEEGIYSGVGGAFGAAQSITSGDPTHDGPSKFLIGSSDAGVATLAPVEDNVTNPGLYPIEDETEALRRPRALLPYSPCRPTVGGVLVDTDISWPRTVAGTLTVGWKHRNRIAQTDGVARTMLDFDDGLAGPEPGVTYRLVVMMGDDFNPQPRPERWMYLGTLRDINVGLVDTYAYTAAMHDADVVAFQAANPGYAGPANYAILMSYPVYFEVWAVRDGRQSMYPLGIPGRQGDVYYSTVGVAAIYMT